MDNQTTEKNILRNYQYSSIVLGLSFCLFYIYVNAWLSLFGPAVFIALVFLSIALERNNQYKLASIILVVSLWCAPAWCMLFSGGLYSPLLIWMTPTIFMGGVLLGSRWAIFVGSLSVINVIIVSLYIDPITKLSEFSAGDSLNLLFVLSATSAIGLITFYGYSFTKEIKDQVVHLREKENELIDHRDNLEKLVDEKSRDLIKSRDDALKANQVKSEFLSRMSHELRTPMNAILGFAQLLRLDKDEFNDSQQINIEEIINAGGHLVDLIAELLDLSEIEAGQLKIPLEDVEINELVRQCVALVQTQANDRGIKLEDELSSSGYIVRGNSLRLKQILVNLLVNAIKYNKDNGQVTISAEVTIKNILRIKVSDTGLGIKKEELDKLFMPFERLHTKQNVEGIGIGLTISKKLIEIMNGNIGVVSTYGSGSTFWFEIELV